MRELSLAVPWKGHMNQVPDPNPDKVWKYEAVLWMSGIQNTSLSWVFPYSICYEAFLNTWERHQRSGSKARDLGSTMPHLCCSGRSVESIPPLKRWFGDPRCHICPALGALWKAFLHSKGDLGIHDATSVLLRALCRKHSSTQKVIWGTQLPNQMEYVHSSFGNWIFLWRSIPGQKWSFARGMLSFSWEQETKNMVCISHLEPSMVRGPRRNTDTVFSAELHPSSTMGALELVRQHHRLFPSQPHPSRRSWCFQELGFSFPLQGKMLSSRNVLKSCLRGKTGGESILAGSQIEFSRQAEEGGFWGEPSEADVGVRLCWCCW